MDNNVPLSTMVTEHKLFCGASSRIFVSFFGDFKFKDFDKFKGETSERLSPKMSKIIKT